jgi:L-amino acid N-acyltransferase YncA
MVTLRTLTKADLPFLLEVRNDESTRKFLENNSTFTLQECEQWFERLQHPWLVIENTQQEKVGYIRTSHFDEVGCDIHPTFRRQGYAKAAYQEYLKDKTHATLWVFYDNFAKKLYEQLGFTSNGLEKRIRGNSYLQMEWKKQ